MAEDQPIIPSEQRYPEVADIRDFLPFLLHRLNISNDRLGQRLIMDRFGLSLPQWRVIGIIGALGPEAPVAQVLEDLSMNKSQLSREFKALTSMDLVSASTDPKDRRRLRASLTQKGRLLHEEMLKFTRRRNALVMDQLSPTNAQALMDSIDILIRWNKGELARQEKT